MRIIIFFLTKYLIVVLFEGFFYSISKNETLNFEENNNYTFDLFIENIVIIINFCLVFLSTYFC